MGITTITAASTNAAATIKRTLRVVIAAFVTIKMAQVADE
jgi:hypothetical protein